MNNSTSPDELRALQEDIYRGKVLRARQLSVEQRLADVFECSNTGLQMMFSGVSMDHPRLSPDRVWEEVGMRIHRARRLRDCGFYHQEEPAS